MVDRFFDSLPEQEDVQVTSPEAGYVIVRRNNGLVWFHPRLRSSKTRPSTGGMRIRFGSRVSCLHHVVRRARRSAGRKPDRPGWFQSASSAVKGFVQPE